MNTADLIWLNGDFVAWEDAKVHVLTHSMHYGTGVFEGERCYETADGGSAIFRHDDHLDRLEKSAELYYMELPYSKEQIREATHELIVRNGFKSCYIRPLVWRGYGRANFATDVRRRCDAGRRRASHRSHSDAAAAHVRIRSCARPGSGILITCGAPRTL